MTWSGKWKRHPMAMAWIVGENKIILLNGKRLCRGAVSSSWGNGSPFTSTVRAVPQEKATRGRPAGPSSTWIFGATKIREPTNNVCGITTKVHGIYGSLLYAVSRQKEYCPDMRNGIVEGARDWNNFQRGPPNLWTFRYVVSVLPWTIRALRTRNRRAWQKNKATLR